MVYSCCCVYDEIGNHCPPVWEGSQWKKRERHETNNIEKAECGPQLRSHIFLKSNTILVVDGAVNLHNIGANAHRIKIVKVPIPCRHSLRAPKSFANQKNGDAAAAVVVVVVVVHRFAPISNEAVTVRNGKIGRNRERVVNAVCKKGNINCDCGKEINAFKQYRLLSFAFPRSILLFFFHNFISRTRRCGACAFFPRIVCIDRFSIVSFPSSSSPSSSSLSSSSSSFSCILLDGKRPFRTARTHNDHNTHHKRWKLRINANNFAPLFERLAVVCPHHLLAIEGICGILTVRCK